MFFVKLFFFAKFFLMHGNYQCFFFLNSLLFGSIKQSLITLLKSVWIPRFYNTFSIFLWGNIGSRTSSLFAVNNERHSPLLATLLLESSHNVSHSSWIHTTTTLVIIPAHPIPSPQDHTYRAWCATQSKATTTFHILLEYNYNVCNYPAPPPHPNRTHIARVACYILENYKKQQQYATPLWRPYHNNMKKPS